MSIHVERFLNETLDVMQKKGVKRTMRSVIGSQGREIIVDGKRVINFCSNDYLGLAGDARLCRAAEQYMDSGGFGAGASRLVCGNMAVHQQLERSLAEFKGAQGCLVFSTGYMANVGIIQSIFGRGDIIFSDRLNHASIVDGIRLSGAMCKRYPHRDMGALEKMLRVSPAGRRRGIITDSVFSMDGDTAPLDEIVVLAQEYGCLVMIDEAHAFGVMGPNGKGLGEHFGVEDRILIQMGTLSKAAGSFGAYCCGSQILISYLLNTARSFIYTTGMPPSVAAASLKAIDIIKDEPQRRERLWDHVRRLRKGLNALGFDTMNSCTPIIPVLIRDNGKTVEFSNRLFQEGVFISAIRPPTVPPNTARLRLTVTATHTSQDLDFVLARMESIGKELCLI